MPDLHNFTSWWQTGHGRDQHLILTMHVGHYPINMKGNESVDNGPDSARDYRCYCGFKNKKVKKIIKSQTNEEVNHL